jgi:hypothetical protein
MRYIFNRRSLLLLGLCTVILPPAFAEELLTTSGTMFYTDDVGVFSATRRLSRDGDPTQPALDESLTGQGADAVFEPMLNIGKSFDNTTLELQGSGFIYANHTQYNHGTLRLQGKHFFTPETALLLRYYYSPNLFLGDNEERHTGTVQTVGERVTSHIWSARLSHELTKGLEARLLTRYGIRRYNQAFNERNTDFWTVGPHLEWQVQKDVKLGVSYHYERGLANGRHQPQYADDVSYVNHYASIDLDVELNEKFSFLTAFHYERNNWTSGLQEDERNGSHENVYQGELTLSYKVTPTVRAYTGVQYSNRFETKTITNTNVGIGLEAKF